MVSRYFNGLMEMAGFFAIDEEITEHCRRAVHAKCSAAPVKLYSRRRAQTILEILACEAIVETFRTHYPDVDFKVQRSWPLANCIIDGSEASVDIWIGPDREGKEPPEPIRVTIERGTPDLSERIQAIFKRKPRERAPLELTRPATPPAPAKTYRETFVAPAPAVETLTRGNSPKPHAQPAPKPGPAATLAQRAGQNPVKPVRPAPNRTTLIKPVK